MAERDAVTTSAGTKAATRRSGYRAGRAIDVRARRTREALYAAMLDLLREKGFDQIQVREIAARAGTGRTTFFRHYAGKEALLEDVAAREIDALVTKSLPLLHRSGLYVSSLALCEYVDEHRPLWRALLNGGAAPRLRATYMDRSRAIMAMVGPPGSHLPPELAMSLSTGSIVEVLTWWLKADEPASTHEVATIISRFVLPAFGMTD